MAETKRFVPTAVAVGRDLADLTVSDLAQVDPTSRDRAPVGVLGLHVLGHET